MEKAESEIWIKNLISTHMEAQSFIKKYIGEQGTIW